MRRACVAALALTLLLGACGGSSTSKGREGPIAVSAGAEGKYGIFRREPSGELTQLTKNRRDYYPTWSPDGKQIAFERGFGDQGLSHFFVMNGNGSELHQLRGLAGGAQFSWSPDGDKIVFSTVPKGIAAAGIDGTGQELLTGEGTDPAWSPDGQTIVFRNGPELFAMKADGSGVESFVRPPESSTEHLYVLGQPAWSPDGKQVAFVRTDILAITKPHPATIEVVNADGSGERTVTVLSTSTPEVAHPTWSPDGGSIAFYDAVGDRRFGIWVVPSGGGKARLLLEGIGYSMPSWGPAGA